jgi:hypothetical protein
MARPAFDEEEEKPLDPAVEKVRRKLVRFVAINLGLLFIALMAVVAALVYKSRTAALPPPPAGEAGIEVPAPGGVVEGQIPLPVGAKIVSQSLADNRISLSLELADGARAIYIYDLLSRRMVGRFAVVEE